MTYHSKRSQAGFPIRRSTIRESRLDSVYLLASSNLLLEYSSILSKTENIIPDLGALHRQLSRNLPELLASMRSQAAAPKRSIWGVFAGRRLNPRAVEEESLEAFVAGLETVLVNLRQLKAYLEWITDQLVSPISLRWPSSLNSLYDRVKELSYQAPRARYHLVTLPVHLRLGICRIVQAEPQRNRIAAAVAQPLERTRQRLRPGWNSISLAVPHCQQ